VPRIELWTTVFAGVSGGLAGVLWSGLVTTPWLARGTAVAPAAETAAHLVAGAALRAAAGAALGFLFWLGWGLIAVVATPWYAVGLLYGGLCWAALAAPALGTLLLRGYGPARPVAAHAVEWLFTCVAIGLLCAFSWHRYA
jgi:hypothetical protein